MKFENDKRERSRNFCERLRGIGKTRSIRNLLELI
jgi:hypothetical protein